MQWMQWREGEQRRSQQKRWTEHSAEEKLQFAYKTNQASKQTLQWQHRMHLNVVRAFIASHTIYGCVHLYNWNAQRTYRAVHIQIVCTLRVAGACIGCFKHSSHFHSHETASLFIRTHEHVHKFITYKYVQAQSIAISCLCSYPNIKWLRFSHSYI